MKKEETLSDIFVEENYINESVIQEQISKNEGIEFSMTGELIPVEVIEVAIRDFVKELKRDIHNIKQIGGERIHEVIDKHAGKLFMK